MDSSAVPTYLISRLARKHVTVALNGDGGDELFAGYKRFWALLQMQKLPSLMFHAARWVLPFSGLDHSHLGQRLRRWTDTAVLPVADRYAFYTGVFLRNLDELVRPEIRHTAADPLFGYRACAAEADGLPPLARLLFINYKQYLLNDLNVKMDRSTMANSLEARSPFLDTALTEFAGRLPDHYKLRGRTRKYILRAAFRNVLPPEILQRRKMGFAVPLRRWFRDDIGDLVHDVLLSPSARLNEYLEPQAIRRFVTEQSSGKLDWSDHLWLLLTLEIWLQSHARLFGRPLNAASAHEDAVRLVPAPCQAKT